MWPPLPEYAPGSTPPSTSPPARNGCRAAAATPPEPETPDKVRAAFDRFVGEVGALDLGGGPRTALGAMLEALGALLPTKDRTGDVKAAIVALDELEDLIDALLLGGTP